MTHLLHLGMSNAVVAGLLAVVAAIVTWRARSRPALAWGLWLLVLVKLVTPPLVSVSLSWPAPEQQDELIGGESCPAMSEWPTLEVADGEELAPTPIETKRTLYTNAKK